MLKVILVLVGRDKFSEFQSRFELGVEDVAFVEHDDEVGRAKQLVRTDLAPQFERVELYKDRSQSSRKRCRKVS